MADQLCTSIRRVSRSDGHKLQRNVAPNGDVWYWGCVRTAQGFVAVYADESAAVLEIIVGGKEYEAKIKRGNIGQRRLVTLARRFAQEVGHG